MQIVRILETEKLLLRKQVAKGRWLAHDRCLVAAQLKHGDDVPRVELEALELLFEPLDNGFCELLLEFEPLGSAVLL
jgi:hypothetical protein